MMKLAHVVGVLVLLGGSPWAFADKVDCEPARCAVQATIAAECPCETSDNHGRYVSCVAQVVRRLAAQGTIPINCRGKITKCSARSTCGKPGFVTCRIPTDECVIETGQPTGTCLDDPTLTCVTDLDCGARCKVKSSVERCEARGGTVGTATSCCPGCGG
jgi:hypothetical protein